jgi:hypothetical protein
MVSALWGLAMIDAGGSLRALVVGAGLALAASAVAAEPHARAVLFEATLSGESGSITPIAFIERGGLSALPSLDAAEDDALARFRDAVFDPDRTLHVMASGAAVATARITGFSNGACGRRSADVRLSARLPSGSQRALASDAPALEAAGFARRALAKPERDLILGTARRTLRDNGAAPAQIRRLVLKDLAAYEKTDAALLVASAVIPSEGAPYDYYALFLVLERTTGPYRLTHAWYRRAPDERRTAWQILIDVVDLDGTALVTLVQSYDGWTYAVYRKRGGRWREFYRGGGGAC